MSRKKKEQLKTKCIAYLSTEGDLYGTEKSENKQLRYLNDYAKAHGIDICRVVRRNGMGQAMVNKHYEAGGIVVTVDEGRLGMPVKRMKGGRMVLVNERY